MDDSPPSPTESTDSTSIKPVSSLRSRFENLGLVQEAQPPSPATPRNPGQRLEPRTSFNDVRPSTSGAATRASLDFSRPKSFMGSPNPSSDHVDQILPLKKRQPTPPKQRPMSMFSTPKPDPPSVHVESPASPPKHFHVNVTSATPTLPYSTPSAPASDTASPVLSVNHSRTPSRATTPALEARMSAFLHAAQHPDPASDAERQDVSPGQKSKTMAAAAPPPVNRAGKPKLSGLPPQGPEQHETFESLAPVNGNAKRDQEASPFSTPPSSSDSAEHLPLPLPSQTNPRNSMHFPTKHGYFSAITAQHVKPDQSHERPPEQPMRPVSQSFESRSRPPPIPRMQSARRASALPFRHASEEELPGLPPRPRRQIQSGRTSPVRQQRIPARQSLDVERSSSAIVAETHANFMPPPRRTLQSALMQGFNRTPAPAPASVPAAQRPPPPAVPAPRRSVDTRREEPRPEQVAPHITKSADDYEDPPPTPVGGSLSTLSDFPDASRTNRRLPRFSHRPWDISTGYDTRLFAVCGEFVCTTGYITRVWSLKTGESCLTLAHGEGVKITALAFKPTPDVSEEGQRLWLGTSLGEIHEVDIPSQSVVQTKANAHPRREIVKMFRQASQIWSLDDEGRLHVWSAGSNGMPTLDNAPRSFRTTRGHSCSLVVGSQLWLANGKDIYVFQPNARSDDAVQLFARPLHQDNAGEITSGATISSQPSVVYFGHSDGKVSLYSTRDFKYLGLVNVSPYKINALAGAGNYLWAGFNTGMVYVYNTTTTPWRVMKDWHAHENPVCSIITDRQSLWKMGRLQVVTLGLDNTIRLWDGLLEEDWLESQMQEHDNEFCSFEEMTASVLTWNAGAVKPSYLKNDQRDNNFFRDYLSSHNPPDIFIFGFQELVDLEDKKVTAKSFFKSKKKAPDEQEHMSHQYRAWRDHISRCIEDFLSANHSYALLHTSSMVGLFSCVFVKTSIRGRIKQVHASEIKRGMGGLHGNKGALIIRMVLDDSSICMVNCHLAAGQTQTISRNNDIAAILESLCLPEAAPNHAPGTFIGGGDGSMILDHEICILNGDLNYRIDAMPRDTVVRAVKEGNLPKLLERDQLLLSRRKNPAFRLRVFQEMPITFAPTYKYNVGTDDYDSSEKKRAPAWCDRVLFRGVGRIKGDDYRRWEVRVSDHRPVSAHLKMRIKKVDDQKRRQVWKSMEQDFQLYQDKVAAETKLDYLMNVLGLPKKEAVGLLSD